MAMVRKRGRPGSDIWESRREGNGAGALCPVQWQMDGALLNSLQVALGKPQLVAEAAQKVVATCALCLHSHPTWSLITSAVLQRLQVKVPRKADVRPRACFQRPILASQPCSLPQQWMSSSFCPLTRRGKPVSQWEEEENGDQIDSSLPSCWKSTEQLQRERQYVIRTEEVGPADRDNQAEMSDVGSLGSEMELQGQGVFLHYR